MLLKIQVPTRISLFGGGTDLEAYSDKQEGLVISLAINLRQHLFLAVDRTEDLSSINRNEIPYNGDLDFIHSVFETFKTGKKFGGFHEVRFRFDSDVLLKSGLGASAAAVVAIVGGMNRARNLGLTKEEIAERAYQIEKEINFTGRQDAYAVTFGGFNAIGFTKDRIEVSPLNTQIVENLASSLILIHTGESRTKKVQDGFKTISGDQIAQLNLIKKLAYESLKPLMEGDIEKVGQLLDASWQAKKRSNRVTNPKIDKLYNDALNLGAFGGKVCGAGGGGYMIFIVDPTKRNKFIEQFDYCDFSVDWNGLETRII